MVTVRWELGSEEQPDVTVELCPVFTRSESRSYAQMTTWKGGSFGWASFSSSRHSLMHANELQVAGAVNVAKRGASERARPRMSIQLSEYGPLYVIGRRHCAQSWLITAVRLAPW